MKFIYDRFKLWSWGKQFPDEIDELTEFIKEGPLGQCVDAIPSLIFMAFSIGLLIGIIIK